MQTCTSRTTSACRIASRASADDIIAKSGEWVSLGSYALAKGDARDVYGAVTKAGAITLVVVDPVGREAVIMPVLQRSAGTRSGLVAYIGTTQGSPNLIVFDAGDGVSRELKIDGLSSFKGGAASLDADDGVSLRAGNINVPFG